jgi:hypothetical protein
MNKIIYCELWPYDHDNVVYLILGNMIYTSRHAKYYIDKYFVQYCQIFINFNQYFRYLQKKFAVLENY